MHLLPAFLPIGIGPPAGPAIGVGPHAARLGVSCVVLGAVVGNGSPAPAVGVLTVISAWATFSWACSCVYERFRSSLSCTHYSVSRFICTGSVNLAGRLIHDIPDEQGVYIKVLASTLTSLQSHADQYSCLDLRQCYTVVPSLANSPPAVPDRLQ